MNRISCLFAAGFLVLSIQGCGTAKAANSTAASSSGAETVNSQNKSAPTDCEVKIHLNSMIQNVIAGEVTVTGPDLAQPITIWLALPGGGPAFVGSIPIYTIPIGSQRLVTIALRVQDPTTGLTYTVTGQAAADLNNFMNDLNVNVSAE